MGDLLLENKMVKEDELIEALKYQRRTGTLLGASLLAKGYVTKDKLNYIRTKQLRAYPEELRLEDLNLDLIYLVPEVIAKSGKVLPIGKLEGSLLLAKVEGEKDSFTQTLTKKTGMKVEYVNLPGEKLEPLLEEAYSLAARKRKEENKFGNMLVKRGFLNKYQLDIALELQKKIGSRIGKVLILLNFISEEDLAKSLSEYFSIKYIEYIVFNNKDVNKNLARVFPEEFARANLVLPIKCQDDKIVFVLNDPLNFVAINKIKSIFNRKIKPVIETESNIIFLLNYSYSSIKEEEPFKLIKIF